jgi:hypothetical protein
VTFAYWLAATAVTITLALTAATLHATLQHVPAQQPVRGRGQHRKANR